MRRRPYKIGQVIGIRDEIWKIKKYDMEYVILEAADKDHRGVYSGRFQETRVVDTTLITVMITNKEDIKRARMIKYERELALLNADLEADLKLLETST